MSERGMSFIEMLVALAIVAIVLLASGALIVRLSRQTEQQALRAPAVGGATDLALDRLEADVREAVLMKSTSADAGKVLILDMPSGERITWLLAGASLQRRREPLGREATTREVAAGIQLMEWTRRSGHLMDLRLRRREETLRQRTVLLRNVDRGGGPGDRGGGPGDRGGGPGSDEERGP